MMAGPTLTVQQLSRTCCGFLAFLFRVFLLRWLSSFSKPSFRGGVLGGFRKAGKLLTATAIVAIWRRRA